METITAEDVISLEEWLDLLCDAADGYVEDLQRRGRHQEATEYRREIEQARKIKEAENEQ